MSPPPPPAPSALPGRRGHAGSVGMLAVALLFGSALVASAGMNFRDVHVAVRVIADRQAMTLMRRMRFDGSADTDNLRAALPGLLTAHDLDHIAVWRGGQIIAQAGSSTWPNREPIPGVTETEGRRVRVTLPQRIRRPRFDEPGPPRRREPPGEMGIGFVTIEFEPVGTHELAQRALLGLWLAIAAAGLLTTAALILWRTGRRGEALRVQFEQQRHLASLGTLSAVLAHEIRNPLASLKGHAQLLLEKAQGAGDERALARTQRVVDEALRLEALTHDLLAFARSGSIRPVATEPGPWIQAIVAALPPEWAHRCELELHQAPKSWLLDPDRMRQVLFNLIENALDATPAAERITVTVEQQADHLLLAVRDRGPGIPASARAEVFEPFHTTKQHGTGLGLAVARRLVALHGGEIVIGDAQGPGAIFQVRLPKNPDGSSFLGNLA